MSAVVQGGPWTWRLDFDEAGYREYTLVLRVKADPRDGPLRVRLAPGLPLVYSMWAVDNDLDPWVWCRWNWKITPEVEGEPNEFWKVEIPFSNKPPSGSGPGGGGGGADGGYNTCKESQVDNPLLEPVKVSGSLLKYMEEGTHDRRGKPIASSSHEPVRGQHNEWDRGNPTLRVEQNVPVLNAALGYALAAEQYLNSVPMWGFGARCVKLANFSWDKKWYGQCFSYYTRVFDFEFNPKTFDREFADFGTKVLNGRWAPFAGTGSGTGSEVGWELLNIGGAAPDPANPSHFIQAVDRQGNPITMLLNGAGLPAEVSTGTPGTYISMTSGNSGNALTDTTNWRPVKSGTPDTWAVGVRSYNTGDLVYSNVGGVIGLYVAVADDILLDEAPGSSASWVLVSVLDDALQSGGTYDPLFVYDAGTYVTDKTTTKAGKFKVEKYPEAPLLTLLGLPATF